MNTEINIHNLSEFTDNQIIDFVAARLAEQGCKSQEEGSRTGENCLYRGPNNTKCAFGLLIPNEDYRPEFEDKGSDKIIMRYFPAAIPKMNLIFALQNIHDNINSEDWGAAFEYLKKNEKGDYIRTVFAFEAQLYS